MTSAGVGPVPNVTDAPTGTVTISGSTTQGQTLTAAHTLADADGLGAITYTRKADGADVGTGASYVLTQAEVGTTITIVAGYTDGGGTAEAAARSAPSTCAALPSRLAP